MLGLYYPLYCEAFLLLVCFFFLFFFFKKKKGKKDVEFLNCSLL